LKITAREKRYIAIGAVLIAAVLIFYGFSSLLEESANISKKVKQKKERLSRQLEIMHHKPYYEKELNLYSLQLQKDMSRLLPGDNPNVAAADLGKIIENFAATSGIEINQKTPQGEKRIDEKLMRISVQINAICVLEQLVQFLASLENYDKFLIVTDFSLGVYNSSFRNPGVGTAQRRNEIRPTLTISGYIVAPANKPKTATGS
jgi:hypothetical protein